MYLGAYDLQKKCQVDVLWHGRSFPNLSQSQANFFHLCSGHPFCEAQRHPDTGMVTDFVPESSQSLT